MFTSPYLVAVVNVDSFQIVVCRQLRVWTIRWRFGTETNTTQSFC